MVEKIRLLQNICRCKGYDTKCPFLSKQNCEDFWIESSLLFCSFRTITLKKNRNGAISRKLLRNHRNSWGKKPLLVLTSPRFSDTFMSKFVHWKHWWTVCYKTIQLVWWSSKKSPSQLKTLDTKKFFRRGEKYFKLFEDAQKKQQIVTKNMNISKKNTYFPVEVLVDRKIKWSWENWSFSKEFKM